jgi:rod shape-determining protein MreC
MRSKKRTTFFLITSVVCLTTLFHYLGWIQSIEIFLRGIISPVSREVYGWSVDLGGKVHQFQSVGELEEAYEVLYEDALENTVDEVELRLLREENKTLRELLDFSEKTAYTMVGADVIGKNIDPVGSTLIIGIGTNDAIEVGSPVVVGGGILIGKISRVTPETSIVRLLDDNQSKVAATILNQEKSIGVIEGGYGLSIRMNIIPQNEIITIGDTVITSGLEEGVPRGLVIGVVETFEKEPYQPFQSAVVAPPKDFGRVRHVSIIRSEE